VNRRTGRREGGLIGLTENQTGYVRNARRQLRELDSGYFSRKRRNKRFDGIVRRAIADDKALSKADIDRIAGSYSDRLLKLRGDTIARTEALTSLNAGRHEGYRQLIETGSIQGATRKWDATGDKRTRLSHLAMEGQSVAIDEPFVSPITGARLMFPGDTSLGAPASETISCRCYAPIKIDFFAGVA
jgi:hypothetical protein